MTVKELIEKLKFLPEDNEVFYEDAEWGMSPVEDAYIDKHEKNNKTIVFLSNLKG